jgi:5,5'-dehydrodivanillate O-demethylase
MTSGVGEGEINLAQTGPETLAGAYLRRFWLPVALSSDVAAGRAKLITIMHEPLTVYRGRSGAAHAVAGYCGHRGTQLSTGWVEDDCIRCFYHGWKYDADGQCVEQPAEDEQFAHKVRIAAYPVREYLGLIFAYPGGGEPPPFPHIDAFDRPGVIEAKAQIRRTNYYNQVENSVDVVHFNFVHRRSDFAGVGLTAEFPKLDDEETAYGLRRDAIYSSGKVRTRYTLMPVTMYNSVYDAEAGWMTHIAWRVPIDDESHASFIVDLIRLEGPKLETYLAKQRERARLLARLPPAYEIVAKILRGEMHVNEVSDRRPDIVDIQDDVALVGQPPMDRRLPDRLGRSDVTMILLRKIWMRELRALAAGNPVKEWPWPADLMPTHE